MYSLDLFWCSCRLSCSLKCILYTFVYLFYINALQLPHILRSLILLNFGDRSVHVRNLLEGVGVATVLYTVILCLTCFIPCNPCLRE